MPIDRNDYPIVGNSEFARRGIDNPLIRLVRNEPIHVCSTRVHRCKRFFGGLDHAPNRESEYHAAVHVDERMAEIGSAV